MIETETVFTAACDHTDPHIRATPECWRCRHCGEHRDWHAALCGEVTPKV